MSKQPLNVLLQMPDQVVEAVAQRAAEIVLAERGQESLGNRWMTTNEAAEYLRIPLGTFRELAYARKVPLHREGKRLYFLRDDLDHWRLEGGAAAAATSDVEAA